MRNARFSFLRTKSRQRQLLKKATLIADRWTENHEIAVLSVLETDLREVIAKSGQNLAICFDAMVNGESVAATALSCGVSPRTINRLRHRVRQIVNSYLITQEVI